MRTALVLGAGGFIGSHMVKRLKSEGYWVRGVDLKYPEFCNTEADEFEIADLRKQSNVNMLVVKNWQQPFEKPVFFNEVYQFAADMGGAGYIFTGEHDAAVMHNSAQINLNVADAFKGTDTIIFYSSSACMYPKELQERLPTDKVVHEMYTETGFDCSLRESDAYPAHPDSEYGWEKLFSERLYLAYARNYGLNVRIARFHNIYGPEGTYKGGKEKAPAAMCRKVVDCIKFGESRITPQGKEDGFKGDEISVWGDGKQTRSFLYIDDCIDAVRLLMESDFKEPINIGSEEMISINDLAKMVIDISGKSIEIKNIDGPVGVRGRNSNNDLIRDVLNWSPKYTLRQGMKKLYNWVNQQINANI